MKVLVTTNMYPLKEPYFGIFVKRQIESLEKIGIQIIKVAKAKKSRCAYLPFLFKSFYYLLSTSYDLIHAHYGFHSALIPALVKRTPLVITFHRGDALEEPFRSYVYCNLQRFVVSRADFLIAVSSEVEDTLIRHLGAQRNKIRVITCGVDTNLFRPLDKARLRRQLGIAENSKVVLYVGKLSHRKGIDVLMECAKRIPEAYFVIVGEGQIKANRENCRFVGAQSNDTLPTFYNVADIFLLPSRSEGTPVVVLESLSCGVPVIASRVGGIPDVIRDGETGYLVEPEDVNTFEKRLRELLCNPKKLQQMGALGRKDMVEKFDDIKIAGRIKHIYEEIFNNHQQ